MEVRFPKDLKNPIVFLDIQVDQEKVGRMVIELRKDVVPKTVENFRALCTGERGCGIFGKPLFYKGCKFHRVQRIFMAQGGDVVNNDGTCGESIYGATFEDENFNLCHDAGAVSMANYGQPNTNNSQFFITTINCSHLDGTNVVCGYVLRGLGVIDEMEQNTSDQGIPTKNIVIHNCGEISPGEDWGYCDNDGTTDTLPPFPQDWEDGRNISTAVEVLDILAIIKNSGNFFFNSLDYVEARRKYRKCQRYYNFFKNRLNSTNNKDLDGFYVTNSVNLAATELKLEKFACAKYACNEALRIDPSCGKAYYRRGLAEIGLQNYDEAICDLQKAHKLVPENNNILEEFKRAKNFLLDYRNQQKIIYKKLFK